MRDEKDSSISAEKNCTKSEKPDKKEQGILVCINPNCISSAPARLVKAHDFDSGSPYTKIECECCRTMLICSNHDLAIKLWNTRSNQELDQLKKELEESRNRENQWDINNRKLEKICKDLLEQRDQLQAELEEYKVALCELQSKEHTLVLERNRLRDELDKYNRCIDTNVRQLQLLIDNARVYSFAEYQSIIKSVVSVLSVEPQAGQEEE